MRTKHNKRISQITKEVMGMIRKLTVEVDADTITCGDCHGMTRKGKCKVFDTELARDLAPKTNLFLGWMRCRRCAEAENI